MVCMIVDSYFEILIGSRLSKETEQNSFIWGVCIYTCNFHNCLIYSFQFELLALDLANYPRQFCTVDGMGLPLWIHCFFQGLCNSWTIFFYENISNAHRYSNICYTRELLYVKSAWLWRQSELLVLNDLHFINFNADFLPFWRHITPLWIDYNTLYWATWLPDYSR